MSSFKIIDYFRLKDIVNQRVVFDLPLDYYGTSSSSIRVHVTITSKYDKELHNDEDGFRKILLPEKPKLIAYLQGGPGFPCPIPTSNSGKTKVLLDKGYQIIYLDQRGTGFSTPIEAKTFENLVTKEFGNYDVASQLKYILHFRADSIINDLESIRKELLGATTKWSIIGQSYGGFCCFTYLSMFPDSIKEVIITGGVPPVGFEADNVYQATYQRTIERNLHYYDKFPRDKVKVVQICQFLEKNKVELPNGGVLSVERFQQLGLRFGGTGGTNNLHLIVDKFVYDLELFGYPTYEVLTNIQNSLGFDTNVIYALFQEAIYCDGKSKSDWAADRLRYAPENKSKFVVNNEEVFFTGEMVYKSMFDDYAELQPFKQLAFALHDLHSWSQLYNTKVLQSITWDKVPIVAATYYDDQYVDFELTKKVKENVIPRGNLRQFITNQYFHNGLGQDPDTILNTLFDLLEREID
ncbi:pip Proline iminopeptidase [Candida maltosa Xu316]|uniref:Prolyl aminopeptidase A, putative n=1 Tax=Candida maltosa (strain Xu316) TaxID=1245528 RepID=M3ILE6_CANMX|nr:Prolyl aminopeptidase A, putative [Candida maltosa Xu316]